jgi:hypothetical protein
VEENKKLIIPRSDWKLVLTKNSLGAYLRAWCVLAEIDIKKKQEFLNTTA